MISCAVLDCSAVEALYAVGSLTRECKGPLISCEFLEVLPATASGDVEQDHGLGPVLVMAQNTQALGRLRCPGSRTCGGTERGERTEPGQLKREGTQ